MSFLKMALTAMKTATAEYEAEAQDRRLEGQGNRASAAPREHILTCADCTHFEANLGPNPRQGWGFCRKFEHGRFGCAMACEASLSDE